jgi:hypothetical protein
MITAVHRLRSLLEDRLAQLARAPSHELGVGAGATVAERVGRLDLREARNLQRRVRRGERRQTADRVGAHGGAVIAALERDDLVLAGLAARHPVVPRDLHRALVGLGAADGEHGDVEIARRERGELGGELGGRPIRELARGGVVGQTHRLLGDRLGDLTAPVADVHDGEASERVHELLAALGPHPHALGAIDDQLFVGQPGMVLRLVRPQMADGVRARRHGA